MAQNEEQVQNEAVAASTSNNDPKLQPADPGTSKATVKAARFSDLEGGEVRNGVAAINRVMDVTVKVTVELGRAQMRLQDIVSLGVGSVVELAKKAGDPVDLVLNGRVLAQGEVVVVEENFGIRITKIEEPEVRINSLT